MTCNEFAGYACDGSSDCCARKPPAQPERKQMYGGTAGTTHPVVHHADGLFAIPTMPATAQALKRHAERFGTEGVREVAGTVKLDAAATQANRPKRRRRTNAELVQQVLELRDRGLVPAAIADSLNIADSRAKTILRDAPAAQKEA